MVSTRHSANARQRQVVEHVSLSLADIIVETRGLNLSARTADEVPAGHHQKAGQQRQASGCERTDAGHTAGHAARDVAVRPLAASTHVRQWLRNSGSVWSWKQRT